MYQCLSCDTQFDQPDIKEYADRSDAYGYSAVTYYEIEVCPHCDSEGFDYAEEEEELEDE